MELMETIRTAFKELIVPEIDRVKEENREIKAILTLTNKRLDDINLHLADQSRRIDETNKRIDETNKRIDSVREELTQRIDETNNKIDETNKRINRLYEVIVSRDDHHKLEEKVLYLEREIGTIKNQLAVGQ